MKKLFFSCMLMWFFFQSQAQYDTHYTMFMFNKLAINPAYAGSKEVLTFGAHYRNQWQGTDGAPMTFTFWGHTPFFKKRGGLGLSVVADKIGIVNSYNVAGSYAYRMQISKDKTLSIGLQGQVEYGRLDWTQNDPLDTGDGLLPTVNATKINPNFGMGIYYQSKKWYVGASIPRLLKTSVYDEDGMSSASINALRSYYLMGGVILRLNQNLNFQPGALISFNPSAPFELDLNASLVFYDRLWLGLSYRLEDSMNGIVQFQITDQLKAALALDLTLTELRNYSPGSFEVMLQYTMVRTGRRINNIRYF